jgi:hypothetical protein
MRAPGFCVSALITNSDIDIYICLKTMENYLPYVARETIK